MTLKHKINIIFIAGIATALLGIINCGKCLAAGKMNILTSTSDLKSLTEAVGGKHVNVSALATGRQDPHFIQAKPSYMMKAKKADLWVRVGLELEIGYEQLIIDGSRNRKIRFGNPGHLDVSEGVLRLEVPTTQKVDRSMGDVHPLGNPHYWLDPCNGRIMAKNICRRLKQLDPENAQSYESNLSVFLKKLDAALFGPELLKVIDGDKLCALAGKDKLENFINNYNLKSPKQKICLGGWMAKLKPCKGKKIVTYHRSWSYLANRFGLVVADELEPKPGIPPSPRHVLKVIGKMKTEKIKVILMEPFYSRKAPDLIADKTGAKVVVVANSVGGQETATDYISMIDNVLDKIITALKDKKN
jgi:ABC-type Zn uptake system ZnuABC Zn-binding protein ZnuA